MNQYNYYITSVGDNKKHIQITTKYRYGVVRNNVLQTSCKVAVEEVCKRHKIKIEIINVKEEHLHMIVDCPRTMSDAMLMQLIKGGSSYIIFRICPELRSIYYKGEFWNDGYFCCSVGANYEQVFEYVKNQ